MSFTVSGLIAMTYSFLGVQAVVVGFGLEMGLRDFYLSRGYVDVQVLDASGELARERDASFVAFTIREGQQFKLGKISTVSELEGVEVAEFVDVQKLRSDF